MAMVIAIVDLDGKEVQVKPGPADHVAFEAKYEIPVSDIQQVTHIYWLAWNVAFRTKQTGYNFEEWLGQIETIEVVDADPK
jgi:hypothetical protein